MLIKNKFLLKNVIFIIAKRNFRGIPSFVALFPNKRLNGHVSPTGNVGKNAI